jgi:hypothetical protein
MWRRSRPVFVKWLYLAAAGTFAVMLWTPDVHVDGVSVRALVEFLWALGTTWVLVEAFRFRRSRKRET